MLKRTVRCQADRDVFLPEVIIITVNYAEGERGQETY